MNSKEIIDRYIGALEDDLQHYTMVDKDSVKAKLIQFELNEYKQIKQDLEILEILKKNITIEKCYAYEILGINLTNIDEDFKKVKEWLKSE